MRTSQQAILLMLPVLTCITVDTATLRDEAGLRQSSLKDKVFTDGLLWEAKYRSLAGCAVACMLDDRCLAFTLSSVRTGQRRCRAHYTNILRMAFDEPGAQTYFLHRKAQSIHSGADTSTRTTTTPATTTTTTTTTPATTTTRPVTPTTTTTTAYQQRPHFHERDGH